MGPRQEAAPGEKKTPPAAEEEAHHMPQVPGVLPDCRCQSPCGVLRFPGAATTASVAAPCTLDGQPGVLTARCAEFFNQCLTVVPPGVNSGVVPVWSIVQNPAGSGDVATSSIQLPVGSHSESGYSINWRICASSGCLLALTTTLHLQWVTFAEVRGDMDIFLLFEVMTSGGWWLLPDRFRLLKTGKGPKPTFWLLT